MQHRLIRSTLGTIVSTFRGSVNIPQLRNLMDMGSIAFFLPWGVEAEKFRLGHLSCQWIIPRNANHDKVILYLHGGGYAVGSTQTHRALVGEIAKQAGYCALIPEYRLAPENPYPAAIEDALWCYQWLLETGHAPENIIFAGDSAGGGLAMATLLGAQERDLPMPAAAVLIAPWVDLTISQESILKNIDRSPMLYLREMKAWAQNYAGDMPLDFPLISPMYADLAGLPPLLIQVSDAEVLIDEDTILAERAKAAGVEVDFQVFHGLMHVWHIYWRYVAEAREAISKITDFINVHSPSKVDVEIDADEEPLVEPVEISSQSA
ncbi:MAG: alpha/beta hydrolase [Bacteroidota bacterium]